MAVQSLLNTFSEHASICQIRKEFSIFTFRLSELRFYTEEEIQQKIAELVHEISIDKKNTALSKRKLISASDNRTSAAAVGSFGDFHISTWHLCQGKVCQVFLKKNILC
jgi:hypothetical protein